MNAAPAAAKMSNWERTVVPLMTTLKTRFPIAVWNSSAKCSRTVYDADGVRFGKRVGRGAVAFGLIDRLRRRVGDPGDRDGVGDRPRAAARRELIGAERRDRAATAAVDLVDGRRRRAGRVRAADAADAEVGGALVVAAAGLPIRLVVAGARLYPPAHRRDGGRIPHHQVGRHERQDTGRCRRPAEPGQRRSLGIGHRRIGRVGRRDLSGTDESRVAAVLVGPASEARQQRTVALGAVAGRGAGCRGPGEVRVVDVAPAGRLGCPSVHGRAGQRRWHARVRSTRAPGAGRAAGTGRTARAPVGATVEQPVDVHLAAGRRHRPQGSDVNLPIRDGRRDVLGGVGQVVGPDHLRIPELPRDVLGVERMQHATDGPARDETAAAGPALRAGRPDDAGARGRTIGRQGHLSALRIAAGRLHRRPADRRRGELVVRAVERVGTQCLAARPDVQARSRGALPPRRTADDLAVGRGAGVLSDPSKRCLICGSSGGPAWKCPIESPVVSTTYMKPSLPPAVRSDVPGMSSGPELPRSSSLLSRVATSEGMNQEPTVGVPPMPTLVSLMNAFANCVPSVCVVPLRPSPLTMYKLPDASTGNPPPPCHNPPCPVFGLVTKGASGRIGDDVVSKRRTQP